MMPLVQSGSKSHSVAAVQPATVYAGMLLFHGDWEGAHKIAQDIDTRDGSYWHAIVHRQEPDAGNAAYWFRQVGSHPIFPFLTEDAAEILKRYPGAKFKLPAIWNPEAFIDFCESAVAQPGSESEQAAIEIQHAEWTRLMEWCKRISK